MIDPKTSIANSDFFHELLSQLDNVKSIITFSVKCLSMYIYIWSSGPSQM